MTDQVPPPSDRQDPDGDTATSAPTSGLTQEAAESTEVAELRSEAPPELRTDISPPASDTSPRLPNRRPSSVQIAVGAVMAVLFIALATCIAIIVSMSGGDSTASADQSSTARPSSTRSATPTRTPQRVRTATPPGPAPIIFGVEGVISENGEQVATLVVDAPETATSFFGGVRTPDNGPVFVVFRVTISNTSPAVRRFSMYDFHVRSEIGERYQPTIGREPMLSTGTLNPGETVSGFVTFDGGEHGTLAFTANSGGAAIAEWTF